MLKVLFLHSVRLVLYKNMGVKASEYVPQDKMRDLIEDNNLMLLVISRFGIQFGFGDSTINEVCRNNGVDCQTFLAVANLIAGKNYTAYTVSLPAIIEYLKRAHTYFSDFILPTIRRKLIEAINCNDVNDVAFLILKFYDDYTVEVQNHMKYENDTIFVYVEKLMRGLPTGKFNISKYSASHDNGSQKLKELKDIVIRHYRQPNNDLLNSALYDIINCENDLISHSEIEERLFVPAVMKLEKSVVTGSDQTQGSALDAIQSASVAVLSDREKDIIKCVAKGMSNKEIADALFLSIHTVTTHRRNITAKLQIHSPAGLTIYAIINNLIDIAEVNLQ